MYCRRHGRFPQVCLGCVLGLFSLRLGKGRIRRWGVTGQAGSMPRVEAAAPAAAAAAPCAFLDPRADPVFPLASSLLQQACAQGAAERGHPGGHAGRPPGMRGRPRRRPVGVVPPPPTTTATTRRTWRPAALATIHPSIHPPSLGKPRLAAPCCARGHGCAGHPPVVAASPVPRQPHRPAAYPISSTHIGTVQQQRLSQQPTSFCRPTNSINPDLPAQRPPPSSPSLFD